MLKKILIVCAPIIVFFVFLIVFVFSSGSKTPDTTPDTTIFAGAEKENFANFPEEETTPEETIEPDIDAIDVTAGEIIYDAPYTAEEIIDIFKKDKKLLEKIKDIEMPTGYNYFQAVKTDDSNLTYRIEFYGFDGLGNSKSVAYDIGESGEYSEIYELFKKYEYINFIHAIDPESGAYAEENLIAQFGLKIGLPITLDHVPWGEIRYNRIVGEIKEELTNRYIIIPLDEHWYYIYSNIY